MPAPNACLNDDQLQTLLSGTAPESERREGEAHLTRCGECRERLEAFSRGDELWRGQHPLSRAVLDSEALREAITRLKALGDTAGAAFETVVAQPAAKVRSLGDYEILEELGRGGMGVVYRARQLSLRREVALKVILSGQLASPADVRRFHVEAEAAAKLDHPNIVPIFEIGEHEGHHFFSMKLVDGGSLSERSSEFRVPSSELSSPSGDSKLETRNPKPGTRNSELRTRNAKLATLVATLARAVHYAHQRGVLHRDLKPSNILLDHAGGAHVTDFGLAKLLESDSGLTRSGAVMGTPDYMAPEVAVGKTKEVTTAADIYSLGAILYELLTGRPPFHEENVVATLQQVLHAEPPAPSSLNPHVPRDLETITLKCLEKEPSRRYASAAALADDLDRFTRGEPIFARPSTAVERAAKWVRRKPALAAALAALVAVFALGFAGVLWKWRGEIAERQRAENESGKAWRAVTRLEIERAETLRESGDLPKSLAHLARQLRQRATDRVVAENLLSALSHRSFCLPVAALRHDGPLPMRAEPARAALMDSFLSQLDGSVAGVSFSGDGRRVVTFGRDGTARVWDALTGQPAAPPLQHKALVCWAEFSRDGRRVVTASFDHTAQVWDAATGQPEGSPLFHPGLVWHAAFSPDGRQVVTAAQDGRARIWSLDEANAPPWRMRHDSAIFFAAFSQDGQRMLTAHREGPARLWATRSRPWLKDVMHQHNREASHPFPLLSPDGRQILTVSNRIAMLWSGDGSSNNATSLPHDDDVLALAWSADGKLAATASKDASVRLWEVSSHQPFRAPLRHGDAVSSVQFSDDGGTLLTGSRDRTARLWDVNTGRELTEPLRHDSAVVSAQLAPAGQRVATVCQAGPAWLWEIRPATPLTLTLQHTGKISQARFSADGRSVLSVAETEAFLWDANTGQPLGPPITHRVSQEILDVDVSPAGVERRVVTASQHGNVLLRDGVSGEVLEPRLANRPAGTEPLREQNAVNMVRFSPDGLRLVTADQAARVWEIQSGRQLFALTHASGVNCARFSVDGRRLVTASRDNTACVWDAFTGKPLTPWLRHEDDVFWAAFDAVGERVATASRDKTVRIWSIRDGRELLPQPLLHADPLGERHSVEFSPDGAQLVTVAGNIVQVWHAATGRTATPALHHGSLVLSARFNPRGTRLVTACDDGTARLWDPLTGHQLGEPLRHSARVTCAEFSPDGTRVLTSSWDGTARIWPVIEAPLPAPTWLPELAEALVGQRLDDQGVGQPVSVEALFQLRQRLASQSGGDYYDRWARWFLAAGTSRERWPR